MNTLNINTVSNFSTEIKVQINIWGYGFSPVFQVTTLLTSPLRNLLSSQAC